MWIRNPPRYQQKQYAGVVVVQQASHNYTDSMHKQLYASQAVGVHAVAQRAGDLSIKTSLPGKGKERGRNQQVVWRPRAKLQKISQNALVSKGLCLL